MAYPLSSAGKAAFFSGAPHKVVIRVGAAEGDAFAVDANGVLSGGFSISNSVLSGDLSLADGILQGWTGTGFTMTEANLREGGFLIDRFSTAGRLPEIGSCCSAEIDLVVDNQNGTFDVSAFLGSSLSVTVSVSANGVDYSVPMGNFVVDEVRKGMDTIEVVGLDRMVRFDTTAVMSNFTFPMTVEAFVNALCSECGITLSTNVNMSALPNYDYVITSAPTADDSYTCRKLLIWCCQLLGVCGYMDYNGELMLKAYGGTAGDDIDESCRFSGLIAESPITLNGVEIVDDGGTGHFAGTTGFYMVISGNQLAQSDYDTLAADLYGSVGGWAYYPAEMEVLPAPWLWPLDTVSFTRDGAVTGNCSLTGTTFRLNSRTTLKSAGTNEQQASYAALSPDTAQSEAALGIKLERIRVGYLDAIAATIQQLFTQEITVTGSLHSDDYEPGVVYADKGLGIDFANRTIQSQYFAVSTDGKLYAKGGEIGGFKINYSELTAGSSTVAIDRCEDENGNPVAYTDNTIEADGYMYFSAVQSELTPPGGNSYWLTKPVFTLVKGDTEDTTFTVRAIYYSGSTQTGYEDYTFEYGASYVGGTYLVELPYSLLKASDSVVFRVALHGGDYCSLEPQWVYARSSLAAGTDSLGGDESSIYIGTDGISLGKGIITTAFITEVGQYIADPSNTWNYRKWSDGHLEMEQVLTNRGSLPIATATGNIYCSASQYIAVPPMFTSVEHFAVNAFHSTAFAWVTSWLSSDGQTVGYRLLSAESASTGNQNVSIRLTGRWD